MASSGKKNRGRQKIDMKIIEKEDEKLVTFLKRRSGIYKKISEMTVLCGTDILFIFFSPAGNPFSFGHPSIESVANRLFKNNTPPPTDNTDPLVEAHRKEKINGIIQSYNEASGQLDAEKEKEKLLAQQTASGREPNLWWEADIEKLSLQELEDLDSRYTKHINELYDSLSKKLAATTNANADSL